MEADKIAAEKAKAEADQLATEQAKAEADRKFAEMAKAEADREIIVTPTRFSELNTGISIDNAYIISAFEKVQLITDDVSSLKAGYTAQGRVLRTLVQHESDIPSMWIMLPKQKSIMSRFKNPWKALLTNSMMLVVVCPVTLQPIRCGPDGKGWEVYMLYLIFYIYRIYSMTQ